MNVIQVCTTVDDREQARRIARRLVESQWSACVQISGPIESVYRWQGQVESAEEWICTAKTTAALYDRVEAEIRALHPYDEPEIVAVPVTAGSAGYLAWVAASVSSSES